MGQEKKVLIVDDDEDLLMLVSFHFQRMGFQVILAEDGEEALVKNRQEKPQFVLLDWMLPKMNGLEVCKELRKNDPLVYLLFLTAHNQEADRIAALEAGADEYWVKPCEPKEMVARVKNMLRRSQLTQPIPPRPPLPEMERNTAPLAAIPMPPPPRNNTAPLPETSRPAPVPAASKGNQEALRQLELENLIQEASRAAQIQDIPRARKLNLQIIQRDPQNEAALMWLAWYTSDPFEGVRYLERLVETHPDNPRLKEFLEAGRKRCNELNSLITSSTVLNYWNVVEQVQEDRIKKGIDKRATPVQPLGQLLLKKGVINNQQLETALSLHEMLVRVGTPKRLGEVLLEYGYLSADQLKTVLNEQQVEYNSQFY